MAITKSKFWEQKSANGHREWRMTSQFFGQWEGVLLVSFDSGSLGWSNTYVIKGFLTSVTL